MGGHNESNSSEKKSGNGVNDLPTFNAENLQSNMKTIYYSRTFMSIIGGVVAGILGFTGLKGFVFYFLLMAFTSLGLIAKAKFSIQSYFDSWNRVLIDGFLGGLMLSAVLGPGNCDQQSKILVKCQTEGKQLLVVRAVLDVSFSVIIFAPKSNGVRFLKLEWTQPYRLEGLSSSSPPSSPSESSLSSDLFLFDGISAFSSSSPSSSSSPFSSGSKSLDASSSSAVPTGRTRTVYLREKMANQMNNCKKFRFANPRKRKLNRKSEYGREGGIEEKQTWKIPPASSFVPPVALQHRSQPLKLDFTRIVDVASDRTALVRVFAFQCKDNVICSLRR
ncbi:ER membrane protein complex subunit 6 [Senna tora]|uniref:ER membrane protein complex subunit 6 n=1 Tax=Senna tora TaxID=362788 RepID=A0A834W2V3_9FABA|nr:ER membrane protein complex subunit 6 [Senna tora]